MRHYLVSAKREQASEGGLAVLLADETHQLAPQDAPLFLRLLRELRSVPDCNHPHGRLLDAVKEAVGRHNDLSIRQVREFWDHTA
jgi:hypothetical protein